MTATNNQLSATSGNTMPPTPTLTVSCRMLRSPSHESVTSDLSLFSVSSIATDALAKGMRLVTFKTINDSNKLSASSGAHRGLSPNPESQRKFSTRHADIPEILWFEEENDVIKSCAALSSAIGLQKSFSTTDITSMEENDNNGTNLRSAISELALNILQRSGFIIDHPRLDNASRTCSTWVAVGDLVSTSQLPSPHGDPLLASTASRCSTSPNPTFTAADLVRSVNKKVRQNYIRRRLLTTYKAIERLSQSEFNLDRLEQIAACAAQPKLGTAVTRIVPQQPAQQFDVDKSEPESLQPNTTDDKVDKSEKTGNPSTQMATINFTIDEPEAANELSVQNAAMLRLVRERGGVNRNLPLTMRDVEGQRGKPLSKYERNMMIFNWLHTLDDSACESLQ